MKLCFTSALFCEKEKLDQLDKPGHFERNEKYDYFLFTNLDPDLFDTSWDVINIAENENIKNINCQIKKSRYTKFLSWDYFESINSEYDVVFYCDAWIIPNNKKNWEAFAKKISENAKFPFAQADHNKEVCRTGGINAEFERILISDRDTSQSIEYTKKFLQKYDNSVHFDYPQYFENTCFGYDFNSKIVREITNELWNLYTTNEISYRDQPLWNFLLLKHNVVPIKQNDLKDNSIVLTKEYKKIKKTISEVEKFKNENCWFHRLYENEGTMRNNYTDLKFT